MATEMEMLKALDKVSRTVSRPKGPKDLDSLCKQYQKIKGYLQIALPFISKIPVYGAKIAAAITFLMGIADSVCPAPKKRKKA